MRTSGGGGVVSDFGHPRTRGGGGVKKGQIFADVLYGWPLTCSVLLPVTSLLSLLSLLSYVPLSNPGPGKLPGPGWKEYGGKGGAG